MTTNFQPGDKVRVKPISANGPVFLGLSVGATYTVMLVDDLGSLLLEGVHGFFHPSHFELVERAVPDIGRYGRDADMPSYSLKDGEGDWWVYETDDPRAVGAWHLLTNPSVTSEGTDEGVDAIIGVYGIDDTPAATPESYCVKDGNGYWHFSTESAEGPFLLVDGDGETTRTLNYIIDGRYIGIDAEPIQAVAGVEMYEPGADERIIAWRRLADHPIFKDCYAEERPLIEAMVAKLDRIYSEGASPTAPTGNSTGPSLHFEADPAPLQPGDWVQVWAQVDRLRSDGDTVVRFFYGVKHADGTPKDYYYERVRADAIVRPAEGQVPPWVKPARCTSLRRGGEALWWCVQDEGHDDEHASSGFFWATADEDGRITEGGAA